MRAQSKLGLTASPELPGLSNRPPYSLCGRCLEVARPASVRACAIASTSSHSRHSLWCVVFYFAAVGVLSPAANASPFFFPSLFALFGLWSLIFFGTCKLKVFRFRQIRLCLQLYCLMLSFSVFFLFFSRLLSTFPREHMNSSTGSEQQTFCLRPFVVVLGRVVCGWFPHVTLSSFRPLFVFCGVLLVLVLVLLSLLGAAVVFVVFCWC